MSLIQWTLAAIFWISVLTVVYVYFGYPILILVLARFQRKPKYPPAPCAGVTVLIAAYNEEAVIQKKIENVLEQNYPADRMQIIVAADGSTDRTPEIVRKFAPKVELSYIPERGGKMAAIVRAASLARGDIIVFSDANNMYQSDAIRLLVAPFADTTVGATTGAKLIIEDGRNLSSAEGLYWKYESSIKESESILGSCVTSTGEILAVRRELFVPPQRTIINDDFYIALDVLRKGYRMIYVPAARSYEYVSPTAQDEINRRLRVAAGMYQAVAMSGQMLPLHNPLLVFQIISHKYLRLLIPFAMIAAFGSNLFLLLMNIGDGEISLWAITPPYDRFAMALQLLFYTAAWLGNVLRYEGLFGRLMYIPAYLVNSNFATLVGLYTILTNQQSHIWKRARRIP